MKGEDYPPTVLYEIWHYIFICIFYTTDATAQHKQASIVAICINWISS